MKRAGKVIAAILVMVIIVALVTPISSNAAANPKLSMSKKTLYVGGSSVKSSLKSTYIVKLKNKPKKYTISWTIENDKVATVEKQKSGKAKLTAVGVGSTIATANLTDKVAGVKYVLKISITVKRNCAAVKLTGNEAETPLRPGDTLSLTGKMYTSSGTEAEAGRDITDIIKWKSSDEDIVKVSNGLVTAVASGTATVTCYTVQDSDGTYSQYTKKTAEAYTNITVKEPGLVSIKQKTLKTIEAYFAKDVSKEASINNIFLKSKNGVTLPIENIVFDTTGAIVTIKVYEEFIDNTTYTLTYGDVTKEFIATKGNPTSVVIYTDIDNNKVISGVNSEIKFKLFNAEGIDITPETGTKEYYEAADRMEYSQSSTTGEWALFGNRIHFIYPDKTAIVTGTYHSHNYSADGEVGNFSDTLAIVSISEARTITLDGALVTNIQSGYDKLDWTTQNKVVAEGDSGYRFIVRAKDTSNNYIYSIDSTSKFSFDCNTTSGVLAITKDGTIVPFKKGSETIRVYYDGVLIGQYAIMVREARTVSRVEITNNGTDIKGTVMASSIPGVSNVALVITAFDQLGEKIPITTSSTLGIADNVTISGTNLSTYVPPATVYVNTDGTGTIEIKCNGAGSYTGKTYSYKLIFKNSTFVSGFNLIVIEPSYSLSSTYLLETSGTTDMVVDSTSTTLPMLTLDLYEMKGNVKYSKIAKVIPETLAYSVGDYFYRVTKDGKQITTGCTINAINLVSSNGGALEKYETGVYCISVHRKMSTSIIDIASKMITLTDTQNKITVTPKKTITTQKIYVGMSALEVLTAFLDCYDVKIGLNNITSNIEIINPIVYDGGIILQKISVLDPINIGSFSYYVKYTADINNQIRN